MWTPFDQAIQAGNSELQRVSGETREFGFDDGLGNTVYCEIPCLWILTDDAGVNLKHILDSQLYAFDVTCIISRCDLPFTESLSPLAYLFSPRDQKLNIAKSTEFAGIITLRLTYPVTT
jgi:hypothetical protein